MESPMASPNAPTPAEETGTVTAAEPLDTLRIKKEQFMQMLRDIPQMTLEIMRELAVRLNNVNKELSTAHAKLRDAGIE